MKQAIFFSVICIMGNFIGCGTDSEGRRRDAARAQSSIADKLKETGSGTLFGGRRKGGGHTKRRRGGRTRKRKRGGRTKRRRR